MSEPVDPRLVAAHVAFALSAHRDRLRRDHRPQPEGLDQLQELFMGWARGGGISSQTPSLEVVRMVLTLPEVAQALGVSLSTVKRLIAAGDLPAVHIAGGRRVRVSALDKYLAQLERSARVSGGHERSSPPGR